MKEILLSLQDFKARVEELKLNPKLLRLAYIHIPQSEVWVQEYAQVSIPTKTHIIILRFPPILYSRVEEDPKRKEYEDKVVEELKNAFGFEPMAGEWEE